MPCHVLEMLVVSLVLAELWPRRLSLLFVRFIYSGRPVFNAHCMDFFVMQEQSLLWWCTSHFYRQLLDVFRLICGKFVLSLILTFSKNEVTDLIPNFHQLI